MTKPTSTARDQDYLALISKALDICAGYLPKLGLGKAGQSLAQFRALYAADPFYSWFGLDSPLMYAAHKAAGGMTSVYRQIGKGCEWVFNQMLQDYLGLTAELANWSYVLPKNKGSKKVARVLSLDGRIPLDSLAGDELRRVKTWLADAAAEVALSKPARAALRGAVFEVRQGYKSMDSKRQNADLDNMARAYAENYLPVICVLSGQIDSGLVKRYKRAGALVLIGKLAGSTCKFRKC